MTQTLVIKLVRYSLSLKTERKMKQNLQAGYVATHIHFLNFQCQYFL